MYMHIYVYLHLYVYVRIYIYIYICTDFYVYIYIFECTWEITNNERFINQIPPNIIRSIRQLERINKKYVDKKCL